MKAIITCALTMGMSLAFGVASAAPPVLPYPPVLPGGEQVVTVTTDDFLKPTAPLGEGVTIAKTAPTVDFMFIPGQNYKTNLWSSWGDSLAINGKYYTTIGDHAAPDGNAFIYEYDPSFKKMRVLTDVKSILNIPVGDYTPGKIHSRLDMGSDGWLYCATHRGSERVTNDKFHYNGDWILRCDPQTGKAEVVVQGVVPKHCIPNSVLDPQRMIFYGGTAAGVGKGEEGSIQFFAYDINNTKLLYSGPDGPARSMIFARSTGRVYYVPGAGEGMLMRFDPEKGGSPVPVEGSMIGVRAASQETPQGFVYTMSLGQKATVANIWSFNTKTEETKKLGTVAVASQSYVASLDVDPTGRYLYYIPGAHGGADRDGSPIVQFDVKTGTKKVIALLHPYFQNTYGFTLKGTFSSAVDPSGDKLYVTWNISRGSKSWDCVGLTVIHIPESERQP